VKRLAGTLIDILRSGFPRTEMLGTPVIATDLAQRFAGVAIARWCQGTR
jgi:hypothetical protein